MLLVKTLPTGEAPPSFQLHWWVEGFLLSWP